MRTTQIFFKNVKKVLARRNLSLSWLEEKTGVSEVLISTFEWIPSGLSFQLAIKVAMALSVSIQSLASEAFSEEPMFYKWSLDCTDIYRRFWLSVEYESYRKNIDLHDIAWTAGKTAAGIISCATRDKDIDIQRAEAIALLLDKSIDDLIWEKIPGYPYSEGREEDPLAADF